MFMVPYIYSIHAQYFFPDYFVAFIWFVLYVSFCVIYTAAVYTHINGLLHWSEGKIHM